jgi:HAMP domain-containing protein
MGNYSLNSEPTCSTVEAFISGSVVHLFYFMEIKIVYATRSSIGCLQIALQRLATQYDSGQLIIKNTVVIQDEEQGRLRGQLREMEAQLTAEQQRSRALQDTQAQLQAARKRMAELAAELAQQRERSQQAGSGAHGTSGLEAEHQLACLQGNAAALSRCSLPELRR